MTPAASETSTLGGSRNASSDRTRTWADLATGRGSSVTLASDREFSTVMDQSTIISDLASSRVEVENLKSKLAQLEAEREEQHKAIADTVQEQVSKAVEAQMSILSAQMTQLFAGLVSTLQQPSGAAPKRNAQAFDMEDSLNDYQQQEENSFHSTASS